MSSPDRAQLHTHSGHDLHSVLQGIDDPFLCSPGHVSGIMPVEGEPFHPCTGIPVFQYPFGPIPKGIERQTISPGGYFHGQSVHLRIIQSAEYMSTQPAVEDARTIHTKQYSVARSFRMMIDMHKGIYP